VDDLLPMSVPQKWRVSPTQDDLLAYERSERAVFRFPSALSPLRHLYGGATAQFLLEDPSTKVCMVMEDLWLDFSEWRAGVLSEKDTIDAMDEAFLQSG